MKINVVHIIDSLNSGGAETVAVNTVNALNSGKKVNAYLCVTREEGALKTHVQDLSRYIFLNKKSTIDLKAIKKLKKFIIANKISILHAHSTSFFLAYLIKLHLKKI